MKISNVFFGSGNNLPNVATFPCQPQHDIRLVFSTRPEAGYDFLAALPVPWAFFEATGGGLVLNGIFLGKRWALADNPPALLV